MSHQEANAPPPPSNKWMTRRRAEKMRLAEAFQRTEPPNHAPNQQSYAQSSRTPAPVGYESESTSERQTSPSPITRERRRPISQSSSGSSHDYSRFEDSEVEKRRQRDARDQRLRQIELTAGPRFVGVHDGTYFTAKRIAERRLSAQHMSSGSSVGSKGSSEEDREHPPQFPSGWGSRAKPHPNWVTKFIAQGGPMNSEKTKGKRDSDTMQEDRQLLPNTDLPSPQQPTPPESPTKFDVDFTAQSLISSPQLRINSKGRKTSPIPANPEEQPTETHERTILEEEGEQIPNTPITIFSNGSYRSSGTRDASTHKREDSREILRRLSRAVSSSPANTKNIENVEDKIPISTHSSKKGELDLPTESIAKPSVCLRVEDARNEEQGNSAFVLDKPAEKRQATYRNELGSYFASKRNSRISSPPKSDVDPEERITAEAMLFELQDNKSERNSIREPSPLSSSPYPEADNFDETPRPKSEPASRPTPRVTGAFIDTPAPTVRKSRTSRSMSPAYVVVKTVDDAAILDQSSKQSKSKSESSADERQILQQRSRKPRRDASPKPQTRPPLINTAKPIRISEDLQRLRMEADIDDSTLDDFDPFPPKDATAANNTLILQPIADLEYDDRGRPMSEQERQRRLEQIALERMNQHLKNTSSSIRDARQGIERLEHQVSSAKHTQPVTPSQGDGQVHLNINVRVPVPRLWTSYEPNGWRLTWLGFLVLFFGIWLALELGFDALYGKPAMSRNTTWRPGDASFPYVLPAKLDDWTGNMITELEIWQYFTKPRQAFTAADWWDGRTGPVGIKGLGYMYTDEVLV